MKILVIGSGAREHALAWRLAAEPGITEVLCAPGNAGIARLARTLPVDAGDVDGLLQAARHEGVTLTVVGPELPLDRGIVDRFAAAGAPIFGPSRAAAQLECSKVFAKAFMARHGVPTARHHTCDTPDGARALARSGELGYPLVIKADGLAAGKGVVVAGDYPAAASAISAAMEGRVFGAAGERLVLEECLTGPEVSFFALCDGHRAVPLASAQDHKRIFDGDEGPNTGGMGALSPSPLMDRTLEERIMRRIVDPVLCGMRDEGHEYRGFLYVGLMLTADGPQVIEFNVRFGDPEAQVVIPLLEGELAPALSAAAAGSLGSRSPAAGKSVAVGVVLASHGYPASVGTGLPISGVDDAASRDGVLVFHAGTALRGDTLVTAGGRVLTVVGRGDRYDQAIARAYDGVSQIRFDGMHYRRDIGQKALEPGRMARMR